MSGSLVRATALAAASLVVAACDLTDPLPVPERRVIVHAVIDPSATGQEFRIEYLQLGHFRDYNHIAGAEVTVTTPDGQVLQASEHGQCVPNGDQCDGLYAVEDLGEFMRVPVVGGGTYTLHIRTPGGEEATGTTVVPNAAPVSGTTYGGVFNRATDTLKLAWARVPGAHSYHVVARTRFPGGGFDLFRSYDTFTDTSITIAGTARTIDGDDIFSPGTQTEVIVSAVDDNYYTYFRTNIDPFAGAPPSRITGAIGVFGSTVPVIHRAYDVQ